ncbi:UNVERIFIED_CONTAM: hypothetical protein FKN15_072866 [Acipenser sinensis]
MQCAGKALEELLVSAESQECLTVGVYESAKLMNVDPDCVAFCVLATDEEYEGDIALQIHFTLIQAFCFDNGIDINPSEDTLDDPALEKLSLFCEECRSFNEWVPAITLPER